MRFITQAYRIKYGTAIFVTFSPDEKHNLLMVRLSRNRQEDPVWENDDVKSHQRYAKIDEPILKKDTTGARFAEHGEQNGNADDVSFGVSVEDLADFLPTFDQRRRILATSTLRFSFSMRFDETVVMIVNSPWPLDCHPAGFQCASVCFC